jgi:hypothetical protein
MAYTLITMTPDDAITYSEFVATHVLYFSLNDFLALSHCNEWEHYFHVDSSGVKYIYLPDISGLTEFPLVIGSVKQGWVLAEKLNYLMTQYNLMITPPDYVAIWYDLEIQAGVKIGLMEDFTGSLLRGVE